MNSTATTKQHHHKTSQDATTTTTTISWQPNSGTTQNLNDFFSFFQNGKFGEM